MLCTTENVTRCDIIVTYVTHERTPAQGRTSPICEWRAQLQTVEPVEHVLLHCPLYSAARREHLYVNSRPRTLPELFKFDKSEGVLETLRFLKQTGSQTGACAKLQATWEPR
jgi:hypothetical protein